MAGTRLGEIFRVTLRTFDRLRTFGPQVDQTITYASPCHLYYFNVIFLFSLKKPPVLQLWLEGFGFWLVYSV